MYLTAVETPRQEVLHPPQVTPEVFEKFLPYAIALDAENAWSRKFEAEAARAGEAPGQKSYTPPWYSGSSFDRAPLLRAPPRPRICGSRRSPGRDLPPPPQGPPEVCEKPVHYASPFSTETARARKIAAHPPLAEVARRQRTPPPGRLGCSPYTRPPLFRAPPRLRICGSRRSRR